MSSLLQFLIVDDQDEILFLVQKNILNAFQSSITLAKSGHDAIQFLTRGYSFDLIICDFQMPNGDGKSVFDFVQKLSDPVPFILHTSDLNLPSFEGNNFLGVVAKSDRREIIQLIKGRIVSQKSEESTIGWQTKGRQQGELLSQESNRIL